jgi:hypothetical protein
MVDAFTEKIANRYFNSELLSHFSGQALLRGFIFPDFAAGKLPFTGLLIVRLSFGDQDLTVMNNDGGGDVLHEKIDGNSSH